MTDMEKLFTAVNKMHESNSVDMRGGSYTEVSSRIECFGCILGWITACRASCSLTARSGHQNNILNKEVVVAVGHAEEVRGSGKSAN